MQKFMTVINHLPEMNGRMYRLPTTVLCLLFSVAVLFPPVQSQYRSDCEENFCDKKENQCSELDCKNGRIVKNATVCGCCDLCIESLGEGQSCSNVEYGFQKPKECGHGLFCNQSGKCEATECLKNLRKYDKENSKYNLTVNFTCDYFGNYDPVVCISNAICFCVNKFGKRIFGTDLAINNKSMTCECSRDIAAFTREVEDESFLPRCFHNGNYDPLQCTEDKCFCLQSADKIDVTNDDSSIRKLSCYDSDRHENGRTTKCFKEREEQRKLFSNHTVIGIEPVRCDLDGSYSPVQCNPGRCYCVSRNGRIQGYAIEKRKAKGMTCRCIRDKEIMEDRSDYAEKLKDLACDELGNYKLQSRKAISKSFFGDFM